MFHAPVITPQEIAYLNSVNAALDIKPLSAQLNQALGYYLKGYSLSKACNAAGYRTNDPLKEFLGSPEGQAVLEFIRDQHFEGIAITRDLLNTMLIEAHTKSATATEEIMAIRELGKLNDLYPGTRTTIDMQITKNVDNIKQLQRLPVGELMRLAGSDIAALLEPPIPVTYEGEFDRVYTPEELAAEEKFLRDLDI